MHGVKCLTQANEIAEIGYRAGTATSVAVSRVRRARHRAEGDGVAADLDIAREVARVQREALWRAAEHALDERPVEAHPVRVGIDVGACISQDGPRALVQKIHADL